MKSKLEGASILITGANGGIGLETVKLILNHNPKRVVLACRTIEKAVEAKSRLPKEMFSKVSIDTAGGYDMTNQKAIEHAVSELPRGEQFDIVFLQSGGMIVSNDFKFVTANGVRIERTIYQNVIGGYLTVRYLDAAGLIAPGARVVFAGGEGARGIKGLMPKPHFGSAAKLEQYVTKGNGIYSDFAAIGVSKFVLGLLIQKLATLGHDREYIWFSPGLTAGTKGLREVPQPKRFIMENIGFPMMQAIGIAQSPKQAARKYVESLNGKYGRNGDLIGAPEGKSLGKLTDQKPMNDDLTNLDLQEGFWQIVQKSIAT